MNLTSITKFGWSKITFDVWPRLNLVRLNVQHILSPVSGTNVDLHMRRTKTSKFKKCHENVFNLVRPKLLFGLIQLIGSSRSKFDVGSYSRS